MKSGEVVASSVEQGWTGWSPVARGVVVILAAQCVLADFAMCPFLTLLQQVQTGIAAAGYFGLVGCILGQGNLLAAWLAWSEGPIGRRLARHWVAIAILFCAWAIGGAITVPRTEFATALPIVGLGVPLVSIAAQFPVWVTRQWFGWRITRAASEEEMLQEPPLTIRGLMLATLLVAMAVALARLAPFNDGGKESRAIWGVAFLAATAISAMGMLPAGRMLLGMRRFRAAVVCSGVYAAALISLVWVVRELLLRYALNSGPPVQAFAMLSSLMLGYAATLMLAGSVARALGYRLARGCRMARG